MSWRPSSIVDVAALGDLERRGDRLGPLGEGLAISSLERRKNSLVSKVIFGAASVDFVCTHSSAVWWW